MRKDTIKRNIDSKILKEFLSNKNPDEIRQELMDTCNKFEKKIKVKVNLLNIQEIEDITDVRSRYLSLYIHMVRKRIIDLYKIESRDIYGWNHTKKFKAILFKEKLEEKANSIYILV